MSFVGRDQRQSSTSLMTSANRKRVSLTQKKNKRPAQIGINHTVMKVNSLYTVFRQKKLMDRGRGEETCTSSQRIDGMD